MSTPKRYTLRALRAYLASKPARKWNSYIQHENGTCCVLGHLENYEGMRDATLFDHEDGQAPAALKPFAPLRHEDDCSIANALAMLNNGDDPRYQQKTPRARVLKAIDDLIARKVPRAAAKAAPVSAKPDLPTGPFSI